MPESKVSGAPVANAPIRCAIDRYLPRGTVVLQDGVLMASETETLKRFLESLEVHSNAPESQSWTVPVHFLAEYD